MKNLENYGVQILNSAENVILNGGSSDYDGFSCEELYFPPDTSITFDTDAFWGGYILGRLYTRYLISQVTP